MDYSRLDRVRRSTDTAAARRRRGVRPGRIVATRVHQARHGRRLSHGLDHRRSSPPATPRRPLLWHLPRGSPGASPSGGSRGLARPDRRHDPGRHPAPGRDARPDRDAGPLGVRPRWPSRSSSSSRSIPTTSDIGPGLADRVDAQRRQHASGRSSSAPASSGRTAATSRPTTSSRRWTAWSKPATRAWVASSTTGSTKAVDPTTVEFTLVGANGNFPYLVSVFNAQTRHHARRLRDRHDARRLARRDRPVEARQLRPGDRAPSSRATTPGGAARRRSTPSSSRSSTRPGPMVTAYQGDQIDAIVQFDVFSGASLFDDPNFKVIEAQTTNHRQIWMRTRHGPVHGQARPPGARAVARPRRDGPAALQGPGRGRQRPRHLLALPVLRSVGPAADARRRKGQGAAGRRRSHRPDGRRSMRPSSRRSRTSRCCIQSHAEGGRDHAHPGGRGAGHVLRRPVVPGRAGGPALLRRRRARHRRLRPPRSTPDVFLNSALKTEGRLELVAVRVAGLRRRVRRVPDGGRRRRPEGRLHQDRDDPQRRRRVGDPVHLRRSCPGTPKTFTGVYSSALGQMFFQTASKVG